MPEDSPERIKESHVRRLSLAGRHAQEEFLVAEFLSVLDPLLAIIGQESQDSKCCSKPGKGLLQQIEYLLFLWRRLIARQVRLIEVDEVHASQKGDDHEPEIQAHPGGHEEPAIKDRRETHYGRIGHGGGLCSNDDKESEGEESKDVPDNHAAFDELPEAAGEEGGQEITGDHQIQNKEAE